MTDVSKTERRRTTAGLDLGDKHSHLCLIDTESGEVIEESRLRTTPEAFERRFGSEEPLKIAVEVGTHSPWVSRLLKHLGHEVLVANARKVRLIYAEGRKTDRIDAEKLARLLRLDPSLLYPIEHRDEDCQAHLALIHSREALVRARTQLVNHVRGTVKSFGHRLPKCSAGSFHYKVADALPAELMEALGPVMEIIASLTEKIKDHNRKIETLAEERYPETRLLQAGARGGGAHGSHLRPDPGGARQVRQEPQGGPVPGAGAKQCPVRAVQSPEAHLWQGRRALEAPLGRQRPLHPRSIRPGHGSQAPRGEDSREGWERSQEASGGSGGQETLGGAAQAVGHRGDLRPSAQLRR